MAKELTIVVNGTKLKLPKTASVNGEPADNQYAIKSGDEILIHHYYTVAEIARFMDVPLQEGISILVNDTPAKPETNVYENFTVTWDFSQVDYSEGIYTNRDNDGVAYTSSKSDGTESALYGTSSGYTGTESVPSGAPSGHIETGSVSGTSSVPAETQTGSSGLTAGSAGTESASSRMPGTQTASSGSAGMKSATSGSTSAPVRAETNHITVIVNRQPVVLTGKASYVFVDIFEFYPFDLHNAKGKSIEAQINDRPAEYLEQIHDGDVIDIYWRS
jgi:hypothetical protein